MNKNKIMEKIKKWNSYSSTLKKERGQKQTFLKIKEDFYLSFLYFCDEYDYPIMDTAIIAKINGDDYKIIKDLGSVNNMKDAYKTLLYARKEIGQV